MSKRTRVIFCKSSSCQTDKLSPQEDLPAELLNSLEWREVADCCHNFAQLEDWLSGNVIFLGCGEKVLGLKLLARLKKGRLVFADMREEIVWRFSKPEDIVRECTLALHLALMQLKHRPLQTGEEDQTFQVKTQEYLKLLENYGPNPFKM